MHKRDTVLDEMLAEKLQRAEQNYQTAAQEFYDELCRASERQAAREGIELGSFATLYASGAAQAQNLFVVVGFGPVVYHGLHNYSTRNSPDGAWSAWVRAVSPTGRFTRDTQLYPWYSDARPMQFQRYPGSKKVKRVKRSVEPALWEE